MSNNRSIASNLMHQYSVQRKNLVSVCRLAVKSLIDKACLEIIDETSKELQNFCIIMEQILCHRLKPQQKWYGTNDSRSFWEYVKVACSDVTHNCLKSIKSLEKPRTSQGKGRAWLRMVLMEKRLSEYLSSALHHTRLTRAFYSEGSLMLTEEVQVLTGVLLGLNAIDFSFDIRSEDLDQPFIPVIDFAPYLKFVPVAEMEPANVDLQELSEMSTSVVSDVFGDDDPTDTWPNRFSRLDNKYRLVVEQKGYLEELVRLRDSQISEIHCQKKKLIEAMQHYENESRKDRQQLESVIIELQSQISQMKEEKRTKHQNVVVQYQSDPPSAHVQSEADLHLKVNAATGNYGKTKSLSRSSGPKVPSSHLEAGDSKSIQSTTSTGSAINVPGKSDDSHSMIPLAGSFTSETSVKTVEATAQDVVTSSEQPPQVSDRTETPFSHTKEIPEDEKHCIPSIEQSSHTDAKAHDDNPIDSPKFEAADGSIDIKKDLDPEKQEDEGMEKSDEEKPIET